METLVTFWKRHLRALYPVKPDQTQNLRSQNRSGTGMILCHTTERLSDHERSAPARRTSRAGGVNEKGVYPGVGLSATETGFFRDFLEC